ncbi:hypothetical protein [Rhodococcus pyridinivorans]
MAAETFEALGALADAADAHALAPIAYRDHADTQRSVEAAAAAAALAALLLFAAAVTGARTVEPQALDARREGAPVAPSEF